MTIWQQLLAIAGCGFLLWWLYRGIKGNPEAFTKDSMSKSFMTMGVLALLLIGVVALAVMMLRRT
jgi:hypothetical protein